MSAKFYEVTDPYYALIKADTEEDAIRIYAENVDGLQDGEIREVTVDHALEAICRSAHIDPNGLILLDGDLL